MLPNEEVRAQLSLRPGKYAQPPNIVFIPKARKTFPIVVQCDMEASQTCVVGAPKEEAHEWCLLDERLRQVQEGRELLPYRPKEDPCVTRTVQGGGAINPEEVRIELTSAKLKGGHTYTLLCKSFDVLTALDFVAVAPPVKSTTKKATKRKAAAKKKAKKVKAKKKAAKRKPAKKKAARKGKRK